MSLGGEAPPVSLRPMASARRARCADYSLTFEASWNDEPDGDGGSAHDEERAALKALVDQRVLETGLVGFVGEPGLEGTKLLVTVRRDVAASVLHGVASSLTLFLVPFWTEVTYEVRAEVVGPDAVSAARGSDSWHVLVSPFLVFAMPFDDPVHPVAIVERLTRAVLIELVAGEEGR